MVFSGQLDEFIHDVTYLRGIFGYLNKRKLSLCGAVVSLTGADENHKFIWPNWPWESSSGSGCASAD